MVEYGCCGISVARDREWVGGNHHASMGSGGSFRSADCAAAHLENGPQDDIGRGELDV